jgi:ABC-2 type transport system permease protein
MRDIGLLIITSIKNNLKSKTLTIVFICITLMLAAGLALFFCLLLLAPEAKKALPDKTKLEMYLSLIMYVTCILGLGLNMNMFAFQSMTREKSRGNIESLLATPLKVKDIWIAKSLAVFIPGLVVGEVLTFIILISINYIYFIPKTGFIITPWIAISSFLAVPLVYLCLSLLVHFIGLTGKPATGNIIVQIFLPVSITLIINLILRGVVDAASWSLTLVNIVIAAVLIVIVIFLLPRLTRERIVLSDRS